MQIPRLIFGTLSLERQEPAAAVRLVHAAMDRGVTAFDTAPLYGLGNVERTLGVALRGRRERVLVLTKCGIRWDHPHGTLLFEADVGGGLRRFRANGLPESIREEVDRSLERLSVDVIDVIQVHRHDASVPLAETLGALSDLVRAGKVRAIGVSNFPLPALEGARGVLSSSGGELWSTQDEYNALERGAEHGALAFARRSGVRFLSYSPLAGGVLSGRYLNGAATPEDHRKGADALRPENLSRINPILRDFGAPIARSHGATLSQLGLAWVLAQPGVSAAIAGASSEAQIEENAAALGLRFESRDLDAFGQALLAASPGRASLMARARSKVRRALGLG